MRENNVEQWKPVKDYEGLYEASSLGRIKSVERTRKNGYNSVCPVKERILKPSLVGKKGNQYLQVNLYKNGVAKHHLVHVLVALSFPEICGLPFEGAEVNHIDEDHFNNVPENLNWLSHPENINHGTRNERAAKANSKTVYQYTKDTHEIVKEWQSAHEVQRQMGWSHANISACCLGIIKTYKGFIWSYESEPIQRDLTHGLCKTVFQYTLSGELVKEWSSVSEVHNQMGWSCSNISRCCNGKLKTSHGYIWSYTPLQKLQ